MGDVLEIHGLHKHYRRLRRGSTVALDGLDLAVPEGGVYGFLGPNGSGKTTTIRCLLGLARPTAGACRVLGADSHQELHKVISRVGSIVESPSFFPRFSGRRNLELLARMYRLSSENVDAVLETVGLSARARDRVRTYSLGMRQRLGIAAALLKDPSLLILDEPANGLDPAGIKETRELLRRLGDEGRTVFLSSHILSEISQTCRRVAILSEGKLVTAGDVEDILSGARPHGLVARVPDPGAAVAVLRAAAIEAIQQGELVRVPLAPEEGGRVTKLLADAGLYLTELRPDQVDLETVFLELTRQEPQ